MASSPSPPSAAYSPSGKTRVAPGLSSVDLLQLATSSLAAAVAASQPIRRLAEPEPEPEPERDQQDQQDQQQEHEHHQQQQLLQQTQQNGGGSQKNVRTKLDGTVVTDADGAAQRIIVAAIRHVSSDVRIVGEESRKEMESNQSREFEEATRRFLEMDVGGGGGNVNTHVNGSGDGDSTGRSNTKTNGDGGSDEVQHEIAGIFEMVREEITKRYNEAVARDISLPIVDDDDDNDDRSNTNTHAKPPSGTGRKAATCSKCAKRSHHRAKMLSPRDRTVDSSRVSVLIDPLDGTSCYASGKHEYVTTLVAIVLDNTPIFGVICKPFGHAGEPCILNSGCFAVYGGALLGGIYVAGGDEIERSRSFRHESQQANDALPSGDDCRRCVDAANRKAVISKSRAGGVVGKCIAALADEGLLHREPVLISGAGVKALQLLVGTQDESLWFFPKAGTSLWDVAAADALLRVIGGRLSDKNGNDIDYSKSRYDAENNDGIIVCNDAVLHSECVQIFQEADWRDDD